MLLFVALCSIATYAQCCNACGCGAAGSTSFGVLPLSDKHFIGIRNYFRSSNTHDASAPQNDSKEYFSTIDVLIRYYPIRFLQLVAVLPYQITQQTGGSNVSVNGWGDASALVNYQLLGKRPIGAWINNVWLGVGMKFPTGSYDLIQNRSTLSPYLQPGTGTYDYLFNAMHALKYKNWGWNTTVLYKVNEENKATHYQFGNNWVLSSSIYHRFELKKIIMLPNINFSYQNDAKDKNYTVEEAQTGGQTSCIGVGTELFINQFNIGFTISEPINDTHAIDMVKSNTRFLLTTIFNF